MKGQNGLEKKKKPILILFKYAFIVSIEYQYIHHFEHFQIIKQNCRGDKLSQHQQVNHFLYSNET